MAMGIGIAIEYSIEYREKQCYILLAECDIQIYSVESQALEFGLRLALWLRKQVKQ